MIRLPNYEVAISALPNPNGPPTPILALSFGWEDTDLPRPSSEWDSSTSRFTVTGQGLLIDLSGDRLLFPLDDGSFTSDLPGCPLGLPRTQFLSLLASYRSLYVCAFDGDGDMLASIGFMSHSAQQGVSAPE